jgi:quinol monooxygenase YgiN
MKKGFQSLLAICFASIIFSCNNSADTAKETVKDSTKAPDTVVAAPVATTPAPAAFTPFDIAEISHTVKDYAKWRPAFNTDSTARKASGMSDIVVGRENGKPNNLLIALAVSDVQKAKDFAANPRLKEVMDKNGVISKPVVAFFHVIRFNGDSKEKQWVVITHKVKDFDAWLKAFDNESTAGRAAQGLIDVVLARGIDNPNIVQIVFDIKDMAKAKARINSPELKKLMTDAGVEGAPKIQFYTSAD